MPDGDVKEIAMILYSRSRAVLWRNLTERRAMAALVISRSVDTLRHNYEPQVRQALVTALMANQQRDSDSSPSPLALSIPQLGTRQRWTEIAVAFIAGAAVTLAIVLIFA